MSRLDCIVDAKSAKVAIPEPARQFHQRIPAARFEPLPAAISTGVAAAVRDWPRDNWSAAGASPLLCRRRAHYLSRRASNKLPDGAGPHGTIPLPAARPTALDPGKAIVVSWLCSLTRQHDPKSDLAAPHALVSFGHFPQWKGLNHRMNTTQRAEPHRIFGVFRHAGVPARNRSPRANQGESAHD